MKIERSKNPILFFSQNEKKQIVAAVQEAEKHTSGEIRVHLERKAGADIIGHARRQFERLGMTQTENRNGVLLFMGVKSRRFAILGDQGINEKVPAGFWDEMVERMVMHFKQDRFADGISEAVLAIGRKLGEYFPYERSDINELPDEISYSL
ncbi:MAG: TPM domain-containing protein [Candidatus Omnitrophota bacterium]|nr:TPM domain-containing protein [Candidatus Omnitrophota bacterium]